MGVTATQGGGASCDDKHNLEAEAALEAGVLPRSEDGSNADSLQHSRRESAETIQEANDDAGPNSAPTDLEAITTVFTGPLYSVFTLNQKRFIVFMAAIGGLFSAISANIYFPALNALAATFNVTPTLINLTLTTYMIVQGIAPLLMGDLADTAGRRPAYLMCFIIYIGANIGLALCPSYGALLVLRCLQSAGSSATISLGSGVVADIADASERGLWMGFNTAGPNIAPALGPVLGGVISQYLGWRWIFWFLTIAASAYLVPLAIFFPETSRNVVDNGSIPPQGWNMSLINYLQARKNKTTPGPLQRTTSRESIRSTRKQKLRFPNPLHGLKLLGEKDIGLLLLFNAILFVVYYTVLSTIPYFFAMNYGYDDLDIGLCFLPLGVGALAAPIINGNLLDWNFRRTAKMMNLTIDRKRATDLRTFPLEKARMQILMPFVYSSIASCVVWGWLMQYRIHVAAPLVMLFIIGVSTTSAFGAMNVLLVDLNPQSPATAIAANNFCRCWIGAGATAAIVPAIEAMGAGGAFCLVAGLLLLCTPISWVLIKKGPDWREERRLKKEKHAQEKEGRRHRRGFQNHQITQAEYESNEKS